MPKKSHRFTTSFPPRLWEKAQQRGREYWGDSQAQSGLLVSICRDWLSLTRWRENQEHLENCLLAFRKEGLENQKHGSDTQVTIHDELVKKSLKLRDSQPSDYLGEGLRPFATAGEIEKEVNRIRRVIRSNRRNSVCFTLIKPHYLHGYHQSGNLDVDALRGSEFRPMRDLSRYRPNNPELKHFINEVMIMGRILNPITIYCFNRRLYILDGLARFAAFMAMKRDTGRGGALCCRIFFGSEDLALKESVLLNFVQGARPVAEHEFKEIMDRLSFAD